jgi:hypothetical protein
MKLMLGKNLFLVCACTFEVMVHASELPTLLYSSAERQAIKQARNAEPGVAKQQTFLRYAGLVQRVAGKDTVWMNEQVHKQGEQAFFPIKDKKITVQGLELYVGDQFDTVNGTVKNLLPKESIQKKQ